SLAAPPSEPCRRFSRTRLSRTRCWFKAKSMDHRPILPIAPQGFGQVKQAPIPEGLVRPPSIEVKRSQATPSLAPIQDRTQPPSQPAIKLWKDRPAVAIPKVVKPALQHRFQLSTDGGHWPGARP